jgi:ring-1,2-phenylacetyl-CoA epoxidase subunit PaaC
VTLTALNHADDNLVIAQRLSEWVAAAPDLELDIALANIALDHLGVARALLTHAADLEGAGRSEDDLAMLRFERELTNLLICEQPNGDFGQTITRQLLVDGYQMGLWDSLKGDADAVLAGIAQKALLESRYHFRHSSTWVIRLGQGTEESHRRMQNGMDAMWRFVDEMFDSEPRLRPGFDARIDPVLTEAGLVKPSDPFQRRGGRTGIHTEHLGHLLAEMQSVARSYPGVSW